MVAGTMSIAHFGDTHVHKYMDTIASLLAEAGNIASTYFGKVAGVSKGEDSNQVLTAADIAVGQFLVKELSKTFPSYNIIEEETGAVDKGSLYTWVIDPIDGTSNFAEGVPTYGIAIGLLEGYSPIAGGIGLPAMGEVCVGERGRGSWCGKARMAVRKDPNLLSALVAYGIDSNRENPERTVHECALLARIVLEVRNIRSSNSAFDAIMVAQGKYGVWLNNSSKIWDNVAQQIVIEEAGGVYTNFVGGQMDYSTPLRRMDENYTFCTGAPALHAAVQRIVRGSAA